MSYEVVCQSDFEVLGFQDGEEWLAMIRLACTILTISIISSLCNKWKDNRLLLFCSHWLSGLTNQMAEAVLSYMILNCWIQSEALNFIKTLKLLELVGENMLAATNLIICVNLALIVSKHRKMVRVKSYTSRRVILTALALSTIVSVAAVPFWDTILVTGTTIWASNDDEGKHNWVMISEFMVELVTGIVMSVIVGLLFIFRGPELRQVWNHHRRIKSYFALTVIAIVTDLAIGVGGIIYVRDSDKEALIKTISFSMRNLHIALDTLVLYSALGLTGIELNIGPNSSSEEPKLEGNPSGGVESSVMGGDRSSKRSAVGNAHDGSRFGSGDQSGRTMRRSHVSRIGSPDIVPLPV